MSANCPGHSQRMLTVKQHYVELIGVGTPQDVAVTPSTSYALSLVAASVNLRPGQQIVVLEAQSASNVMQWQACVERCKGSHLTVVSRPAMGGEGERSDGWTCAVVDAIRERDTAVVGVAPDVFQPCHMLSRSCARHPPAHPLKHEHDPRTSLSSMRANC
jgi:hypothetical protein